jgi:hypothetical protein
MALVLLVVFIMSTSIIISEHSAKATTDGTVFVGVTFGGTTVQQAKQLIDKVKSYTNLFVIDSWTIDGAFNSSAGLDEICDYAVNANLSVMVYFSFIYYNYSRSFGNLYNSSTWELYGVSPWHVDWLNQAKVRYGDKFLGAYLYDEPGGKQIDTGYWGGSMTTFTGDRITSFDNVTDYDDAANRFTRGILTSGSMQHIINSSIPNSVTSPVPVFTSDYALYWFDYKAGYSSVFVELGGNLTANGKITQIALCRGAATAQNKDWGVIVTLATNNPPTPQSEATMLNDMTLAYEAGAKYISVFNYGSDGLGSLTDEHYNAIKQFWDNIHSSSADYGKSTGQVALVLPTNYGWGMRDLTDKIWGHWPADNESAQIWNNMNTLIAKYGLNLDIVYDDPQVNIGKLYDQTYLWNETFNLAAEPSLTNVVYVVASVLGPVGAAAGLSEYLFSKRKKKKPTALYSQASSPNQRMLVEQLLGRI